MGNSTLFLSTFCIKAGATQPTPYPKITKNRVPCYLVATRGHYAKEDHSRRAKKAQTPSTLRCHTPSAANCNWREGVDFSRKTQILGGSG